MNNLGFPMPQDSFYCILWNSCSEGDHDSLPTWSCRSFKINEVKNTKLMALQNLHRNISVPVTIKTKIECVCLTKHDGRVKKILAPPLKACNYVFLQVWYIPNPLTTRKAAGGHLWKSCDVRWVVTIGGSLS